MKEILRSFGKQLLFWFLFFALSRIIFILYYHKYLADIDLISIIAIFPHGLKLDISTLCYIMAIPFLLLTVQTWIHRNWMNKFLLIYHAVIIFIFSLIITAELGIFDEWQTKLSVKALRYLSHPSEVFNSAATGTFFLLILILMAQCIGGFIAYKKWFWHKIKKSARNIYFTVAFFVVTLSLMIIGFRGGVGEVPINQSDAYFSKHNILNLVAVNSGWNMLQSISQNFSSLNKNPFIYYKSNEAAEIVKNILHLPKDTTIKVLKVKKPNIVLIIFEGWSADLIESYGGHKGITPCFKELEKGGILFKNIYASGTRSEQGMSNIFGGFPSHPLSIITRQPDKFIKLPSLTKTLAAQGYHSSFFFGGQLAYGNMKGYIYSNNFDKIVDEPDFKSSIPRGKLGIHDEYMYRELMSALNNEKKPFFSALFTVSTHSPYDIPNFKENIKWPALEKEYVNAAYYADSCLGDFIAKAKKQPWFANTLFIMVSDHGHSSYKPWDYWTKEYQRIPMLFYGAVIKDSLKGTCCEKYGSQVDIAATLLHQLGMKSDKFRWSKDLLNPYTHNYAYYSYEVGLGWVCPEGYFSYEHNLNKFFEEKLPKTKKDSIEKAGKAYLQEVYKEYWNY
jgi:phosphoglycerol transferase MdoB-like AlkP superfamily enzyme